MEVEQEESHNFKEKTSGGLLLTELSFLFNVLPLFYVLMIIYSETVYDSIKNAIYSISE